MGKAVRKSKRARAWTTSAMVAAIGIIVAAGCAPPPALKTPPQDPPNIILVSLDTLRADHLGCYGYELDTSPALDAFAEKSVVFGHAVAQSSHTSASHISLFKSRIPSAAVEAVPHLAELLTEAGYQSVAFTGGGKISAKAPFGFDRGFERYEETPEGFSVSAAIIEQWLQTERQRPFFLFIHTYDIHSPYNPGTPYNDMYYPDYEGPVRADQTRDYLFQLIGMTEMTEEVAEIEWNADDRRRLEALYDGGIRATDNYVGQLLSVLDQVEAWDWDRDVVVFFSDHGEEFWEHDSVAHGITLYQEVIRVALILRLPGARAAGARVRDMVRLMDVAPTLLELAGVETPEAYWGRSLLPLIEGKAQAGESPIAVSQTTGVKTIISYPWKLIIDKKQETPALYNILQDPHEQEPLQDQHPEIAAQLTTMLQKTVRNEPVADLFVEGEEVEDEALREQLRALGYIE